MKHGGREGALRRYEELLRLWAPRLDLISPRDEERLWSRHIADSLRALPLVEAAPAGWATDVGSGAGLPGLVLAIASDRPWRLLEPRRKRAAFLEEAVRELGLDRCEVLSITAEQAARDPSLRAGNSLVTARALAEVNRAAELCLPLVRPGGAAVLFLGKSSEIPSGAVEVEPGLVTIQKDA